MFTAISPDEARRLLEDGTATLVDLRDAESRVAGHIASSIHLTDQTLAAFVATADRDRPVILYCYHGNMSQSAARLLDRQGFHQVYSMTGGYAAWRTQFSSQCTIPDAAAD